jgi:hypothetical protein
MTLNLRPEIMEGLQALAAAQGLSVEMYLQRLIEDWLPATLAEDQRIMPSGVVSENGLFVYKTGRPLSSQVVDEVFHSVREERARNILGDLS